MKSYIFDLDGTLIDSYNGILESLMNVLKFYNINQDKDYVYSYILEKSVHEYLNDISINYSLNIDDVRNKYSYYRLNNQLDVKLMPNAKELLDNIKNNNDLSFMYTHKGNITYKILENLGIKDYFKYIVTSDNKFKLKPDPEGINYILNKYNIKKEDAIYIGDRPLDIACAKNAGIRGILYKPANNPISIEYNDIVKDLIEITKEKEN